MEFPRRGRAVTGGSVRSRAQKKAFNPGTAKMKTAADRKLGEESERIVGSLCDRLIAGNVTCGKLLIALAEGQIDCEDEVVVQQLCSLAEKLAMEPEWTGEMPEDEADTELGQVSRKAGDSA
jgi:hypothetical protein